VKLYSNFVPIYGEPYTTVEKKIDVPHELKYDIDGEGQQTETVSNELSQNERESILDNLNKSVKEKLPETVYKSLLHPAGIKTGKILVNQKPQKRLSDEVSIEDADNKKKVKPNPIKHKFHMEAQLVEPLSFPSQNYAESFFHSLPTDSRFLNCNFQKFMPSTTLDADTITFNCSRFEAPNVYQVFVIIYLILYSYHQPLII